MVWRLIMTDTIDLYELVRAMYSDEVIIDDVLIDDNQLVTIKWTIHKDLEK